MIEENLVKIRQRITLACAKINKDPSRITLVTVTKNRPLEEIKLAIACGLTEIGENRVQEALLKYSELKQIPNLKWHLIGHLQTNKAKEAVEIFDLIHSVDSFKLAQEIDKQAGKISKIQEVLIEVNVSGEESKFGIKPSKLADLIKQISVLKNIKVKGLMTVAPVAGNPEETRPIFKGLMQLRDNIDASYILSMGMTDDFEIAIEEGADIIRLGRAIFA